jgi:Tol biopolymer transport system component
MNANGALQTRLTRNAADDYDPAWSPGGTKMAFVSNRDGNEEIYPINPDGSSRPKRLVARFAARILPKRKERGSFGAPARSGRGPFGICATILRQASLHLW